MPGVNGGGQSIGTLRIVWAAIGFSQLLFVAIAHWVAPEQEAPEPQLLFALGFAALSTAGASLVLPMVVFRAAVAKLPIERREVADPEAPPGFRKVIAVAAKPAAARSALLPPYTSRVVLGCALSESVSLIGLVLKFQGFGWIYAAPLFVVGITLTALQVPSLARMTKESEAALGFRLS